MASFKYINDFEDFEQVELEDFIKDTNKEDAKENTNLKIKYSIDVCDIWCQRRNVNGMISCFQLNKQYIKKIVENETQIRTQLKNTAEIVQAITSKNLSKEEGLDLISQENKIFYLDDELKLGFQSSIFTTSTGMRNSATFRIVKKTSTNKLYFATEGERERER